MNTICAKTVPKQFFLEKLKQIFPKLKDSRIYSRNFGKKHLNVLPTSSWYTTLRKNVQTKSLI